MARIEDRLTALIEPAVAALGFELWGVEFKRAGKHSTLRVFIDHQEGISVDDCADVSHQVSAILDVEDPINAEYYLEVSSPGMERPFFNAAQFADYIGEVAAIELTVAQDGKRKFQGIIQAVDGERVDLLVDDQPFKINFAAVKKAHLVPQFN